MILADIHDPLFCSFWGTGEARDATIVFYPKKDATSFKVRQRSNFLRELVWMDVVTLKLDAGTLAVLEQFVEFCQKHNLLCKSRIGLQDNPRRLARYILRVD